MDEFEAAKQALEEGQRLDPSNKQYKPWIRKCQAELDGGWRLNLIHTVKDFKILFLALIFLSNNISPIVDLILSVLRRE